MPQIDSFIWQECSNVAADISVELHIVVTEVFCSPAFKCLQDLFPLGEMCANKHPQLQNVEKKSTVHAFKMCTGK